VSLPTVTPPSSADKWYFEDESAVRYELPGGLILQGRNTPAQVEARRADGVPGQWFVGDGLDRPGFLTLSGEIASGLSEYAARSLWAAISTKLDSAVLLVRVVSGHEETWAIPGIASRGNVLVTTRAGHAGFFGLTLEVAVSSFTSTRT
jgi:hypothetical protein